MINIGKATGYLKRACFVKRHHICPTIQGQTIMDHSARVALFCHLLDPNASSRLLLAALTHDIAETVTGDVPSPTKRLMGDKLENIEDTVLFDVLGHRMGTLTEHEELTLKLADTLDGILFYKQEAAMGSTLTQSVLDKYLAYLDEINNRGSKPLSLFDPEMSLRMIGIMTEINSPMEV